MGIFSFGKKDDAPSRRDSEAGSRRRSSQNTRVERRSRRPARSGDAEAMLLDPTLPEKQRARRRLVGAIALVLAAIVILPMVLDTHPKPVTDDISIDIPSRPASRTVARRDEDTQAGVAPDNPAAAEAGLGVATPGASGLAAAGSGAAPAQTAQSTQAKPAASAKSAPAVQAHAQAQTQAQANPSTEAAQAPRSTAKPAAPSSVTAVASRGKPGTSAAADGDGAPAAPSGARFAVQLGAFSSDSAANKWVTKLKAAGVPAYTEQRKEDDGTTRTLLRAGPFPDRASATEAIAKVRGAGLMTGSNGSAQ
ncbi:Cell division protein DedD [Paraburkholderia caffeinitolerans]|uniref:Cell division protein DedD n=1 Tax=Paraburkholderia caffeinitolerans TaxID=1723730 RepID=A0A6J5FPQ3_9BURK|nr:SPOR domain-containing protein [Paraburkholderia caffeinitolerans]CAB3782781.1 Cell division protein DedD [Paraburkholderia caffeinitolerans]